MNQALRGDLGDTRRVVPTADHYVQCDAPAQLAQIIRLTADGSDITLQTLGDLPDGAVLVDQSSD
jgi:hypothetical protein